MKTRIAIIRTRDNEHVAFSDFILGDQYEVHYYTNGFIEAKDLLTGSFDLIISGLYAQPRSGIELLEYLRENQNDTQFIIVSKIHSREFYEKAILNDVTDYVSLPMEKFQLMNRIRTALKNHEQREEKKSEDKHNMFKHMAHEIYTPLTGMVGITDIMKNTPEIMNLDPELIQMMEKSVARLKRAADNVLLYEKIKNNLIHYQPAVLTEWNNLLTETIKEVGNDFNRIDDVDIDIQNRFKPIIMSEQHFKIVIKELLINAFSFSKKGTVVKVGTKVMPQGNINFHFQNEGRGMQSHQLDRISAYKSFDRELYEQQGLGLGLTIAKKILDLNHGSLILKSVPKERLVAMAKIPAILSKQPF